MANTPLSYIYFILRNFKYWFLNFLFIVISISTSFAQPAGSTNINLPPAAQEAFNKGILAAKASDYLLAASYFEEARKSAPHAPEIFFNLGLAESKIPGRELRAICWFSAYLRQNPLALNKGVIKEQILALLIKNQENIFQLINTIQGLVSPLSGSLEIDQKCGLVKLWTDAGEISTAQKIMETIIVENYRSYGYSMIAIAQAKMGDIAGAQRSINIIYSKEYKIRPQYHLVDALIKAGDFENAQKTADLIQDSSFRSWALSNISRYRADTYEIGDTKLAIAEAQIEEGDMDGARKMLISAQKSFNHIGSAFSRYYKLNLVADAQIRIGDILSAKKTLLLIQEAVNLIPELYWKNAGWSDIAKIQAKLGDITGTLQTTSLISVYHYKSLVQAAIAEVQITKADLTGAKITLEAAEGNANIERGLGLKCYAMIKIVEVYLIAKNIIAAKRIILQALNSAKIMEAPYDKSLALKDIAEVQLKAGDLKGLQYSLQLAVEATEQIQEPDYRSTALSNIAGIRAKSGDITGARKTLVEAQNQIDLIKGQTAKEHSQKYFVQALAACGDFDGAIKKALLIDYTNTRNDALEAIADLQANAGDNEGSKKTLTVAYRTADLMQEAFLKKWYYPASEGPDEKNYYSVSDWTNKLNLSNEAYGYPLNTGPFLLLGQYIKSLPTFEDPKKNFDQYRGLLEKMLAEKNVIEKMLN